MASFPAQTQCSFANEREIDCSYRGTLHVKLLRSEEHENGVIVQFSGSAFLVGLSVAVVLGQIGC